MARRGIEMHHFQIEKVTSNFEVKVTPEPLNWDLSEGDLNLIEEIWKEEREASQGHLFNKKILALKHYDAKGLLGCFIEYKYYIAQERVPFLREKLQICPVAISGITMTSQKLLFGQRSPFVTEYPLFWELAPSGGISEDYCQGNKIDTRGQILQELKEEVGIDESLVKSTEIQGIIFDEEAPMVELVIEIRVKETAIDPFKSDFPEYSQIEWIKWDDLDKFLKNAAHLCVPISKLILMEKVFNGR